MQQRQLRLGDILDDYCPRERRLTNHVVVAMVGDDVKQTRCTTCDADHTYKHAKVPRPRRKVGAPPALHAPSSAVPKRVAPDVTPAPPPAAPPAPELAPESSAVTTSAEPVETLVAGSPHRPPADTRDGEGPVHRQLIRATLPRHEGQQSQARATPDFTIRQPASGRPNRFRFKPGRGFQGPQGQGAQGSPGNRAGQFPGSSGHSRSGNPTRGGAHGQGGGRPLSSHAQPAKRRHAGRKNHK